MDILNQLRTQVEQVEAYEISSEVTRVGFEAGKLKINQVEQVSGIALRVVKDGRLGFAASSDMNAVDDLIANVLASAAFGEKTPLILPITQTALPVAAYDATIAGLSIGSMVELGQEIVDLFLEAAPDAQVNVQLSREVQHISIRNQTGLDISFQKSPFRLVYDIERVAGDDILVLYDVLGSTVWDQDYLQTAKESAKKLALAEKITTPHSGRMPVLFAPLAGMVLALPLMVALNGKNVYTDISPLVGKLGEQLFNEQITVIDDPSLPGKWGSSPYDGEGIPSRPNVLVDAGVLKSFFYDLKTAAQMGTQSTGNGSRDLFSSPQPSTTNFVISPGETPVEQLIAGIDHGLLVDTVIGLGQGNIYSGAFSNPVALAFKIEGGEIVGRVKEVSLAGNIYELLPQVEALSSETQWFIDDMTETSCCLPYLLLPDINLVTKE